MILTSFSSRSPSGVSLCASRRPTVTTQRRMHCTSRARMPVRTSLEPVALTRYRTSYSAIRGRPFISHLHQEFTMKRQVLTLIAIAATLTCGRNYAQNQEVETQTNEEYEHLKVLEPLAGTFLIEGKNEETGARWEWTHTTSWIGPQRKTLKTEQRFRIADNEAALKEQEWTTGHSYHFYVWNNAEKRIEYISVWGGRGVVIFRR